ncbi:MAG TPA: FMN-binding negative transcriptional regulator [Stellaceae bacterium]|nr:FMN-binding negative transcriptional regulator [Stellaceae bacterium]
MVYLPPAFSETRNEVLLAHIERHEFGTLVSHGEAGLVASQIPFLLERRDGRVYLQAHLARANPQRADLDSAEEALAIFAGPHAYVSPSWYEPGPAVPTWNYASVHAYGRARTIAEPDWLREFVRRLTERHEAREPAPPWRMEGLPDTYVQSMLNGILGIEIAVSRLEGKFKLSQNRPAVDRPRIVAALERREDPDSRAVARLMRERERAG